MKTKSIVLIIPNGEGWPTLVVKKLSALLKEMTSKHKDDFYCSNCLHSFRIESKVESHEKDM